jgi:hypothetical protein
LKLRRIEASLLQVANDRFLWVDRRLPIGRTVTRIDLRAVRTDPVLTGGRGGAAGSGQSAAPVSMDCLAETGGIPALLSSLRDNFTFSPPQAMRLEIHHPPDEQPTQLSVFALVGHWRPEKLNALLGTPGEDAPAVGEIPDEERRARPADEPGVSALAVLPERFPYEVLLLLGQGDLVPYRIEYRRRETPSPSQGASPIQDYQLSAKPLCVLELSNVAFDVTATAGLFDYAPGSAVFSDQTAALLERLRRQPPVR